MRQYRILILAGITLIAMHIVSCSTDPPTNPEIQPQIQILDSWGDEELNLDIALAPNAVSPAMPSTKIAFDMPVADSIWLSIYESLGIEVISHAGYYDQGRYEIVVDFTHLGSGVYMVNLRTKRGLSLSKQLAFIR